MRILFLDDDQALLRGMERMLFNKKDWRMSFADSGAKALEAMGREAFDVIVADLRMPGMDGAQVLQEVQKRHPGVVRIVLSGHSDSELVTRAVQPAHQFLSKPCGSDELIRIIQRAFDLRTTFTDPKIRETITRIGTLPVMPTVYAQLMAALKDDSQSIGDIGEIVSRDVGLSSNLLKVVNSSFFGMRQPIATPAQAVTYLGLNILKSLILYNSVFCTLDSAKRKLFSMETLWEHSLLAAQFAGAIAKSQGASKAHAEECFVAGLLHDVGKLVLADGAETDYKAVVALSREGNMPLAMAEKELLGVTHAEVGGYLLGLWGLEPRMVRMVASHHGLRREEDTHPELFAYVHAANVLEHQLVVIHPEYAVHDVDPGVLERGGAADCFDGWRELCAGILQKATGKA
ncbi:MAG: response regulator [Desulfovibrionaceae bacterium]